MILELFRCCLGSFRQQKTAFVQRGCFREPLGERWLGLDVAESFDRQLKMIVRAFDVEGLAFLEACLLVCFLGAEVS